MRFAGATKNVVVTGTRRMFGRTGAGLGSRSASHDSFFSFATQTPVSMKVRLINALKSAAPALLFGFGAGTTEYAVNRLLHAAADPAVPEMEPGITWSSNGTIENANANATAEDVALLERILEKVQSKTIENVAYILGRFVTNMTKMVDDRIYEKTKNRERERLVQVVDEADKVLQDIDGELKLIEDKVDEFPSPPTTFSPGFVDSFMDLARPLNIVFWTLLAVLGMILCCISLLCGYKYCYKKPGKAEISEKKRPFEDDEE